MDRASGACRIRRQGAFVRHDRRARGARRVQLGWPNNGHAQRWAPCWTHRWDARWVRWFAPLRARVRARLINACPRLRRRSDLSPWDRAPAQPLRRGRLQAREGERVDPGPLGRGAGPGFASFGSRGSREPARRGNAFRGRHRRCGSRWSAWRAKPSAAPAEQRPGVQLVGRVVGRVRCSSGGSNQRGTSGSWPQRLPPRLSIELPAGYSAAGATPAPPHPLSARFAPLRARARARAGNTPGGPCAAAGRAHVDRTRRPGGGIVRLRRSRRSPAVPDLHRYVAQAPVAYRVARCWRPATAGPVRVDDSLRFVAELQAQAALQAMSPVLFSLPPCRCRSSRR
jgi:hypothetical protein